MSYVKVNVTKPGDNLGVGGNKKARIIVFDMEDVLSGFARDNDGITLLGNLVMKENAYMVSIYATQETIKIMRDAEGETDAKGIIQTCEFSHPGSSVEIRAFEQHWMNRNIGLIVESCDNSTTKQLGSPCAPLQLVFKGEDDKDKNTSVMTFKSAQKGPNVAEYPGTITLSTPTETVAADETDIDLTNGSGNYQLTDGSTDFASIVTISNAVEGVVFTLLGSGGSFPSTISSSATDFLLKNGSTWTANANSSITFKVFKSGASTYKAIEISRA